MRKTDLVWNRWN